MQIGFLGLLGLLFIGLKLGGVISWSWWWVTAPLWGSAVVTLLIVALTLLLVRLAGFAKRGGAR